MLRPPPFVPKASPPPPRRPALRRPEARSPQLPALRRPEAKARSPQLPAQPVQVWDRKEEEPMPVVAPGVDHEIEASPSGTQHARCASPKAPRSEVDLKNKLQPQPDKLPMASDSDVVCS